MLEVRPRINKLRSLTVKGLLVIGLGTAVQLGCLTAYEVLLSRSDHLAAIEQRDKIVIGEINWLSTLVPVCGLLALDAGANNASSRQMRKECVQLIWQARDFLAPMISASNSLALVRVTNAVIDDCESLSCLVSSQPAITVRQVTDHSLLEKDYKVFAVLRHDIIIENHKKAPLTPELLPNIRNQLKQSIHALIAATILSAMFGTTFFLKDVCAKLAALEENMNRFEKGEPLLPAVKRDDEIGRLEMRFRELVEALLESSRQKQEIMSMVSHDLRTPLSSVHAALQLLTMEEVGLTPEQSRALVDRAYRNVVRTTSLINDLLDIDKLSSGMLTLLYERVSLRELAESSRESVADLAAAKRIVVDITGEDVELDGDKQRLLQVIINLLGNAVKFSSPDSLISITWKSLDEHTYEIAVVDHGRGVPDEHKKQIFKKFRQVSHDDSTVHQGTGLGLAIAKALVEAHGGTIGVRDTAGGGSTFWFAIPNARSNLTESLSS